MGKLKDKILLLKRCISFVIQENKWQDRGKYGMLSASATFRKPLLIADPKGVFLFPYSRLQSHAKILNYTGRFIVKSYAACGDNLLVVTGNHVPTVGVPQFFLGTFHINDKETDIVVEECAWVGANVTLLSGARIGRGALIGGCSMVNKEIPPYAVAVGSPARIIASVFTKEQIIEHEKLVFRPEDRLAENEIDELFEKHFKGMKSIGTSEIKEEDRKDFEKIQTILRKYPY